jgi:hypothetical protein
VTSSNSAAQPRARSSTSVAWNGGCTSGPHGAPWASAVPPSLSSRSTIDGSSAAAYTRASPPGAGAPGPLAIRLLGGGGKSKKKKEKKSLRAAELLFTNKPKSHKHTERRSRYMQDCNFHTATGDKKKQNTTLSSGSLTVQCSEKKRRKKNKKKNKKKKKNVFFGTHKLRRFSDFQKKKKKNQTKLADPRRKTKRHIT